VWLNRISPNKRVVKLGVFWGMLNGIRVPFGYPNHPIVRVRVW
jgi:hypothetical protein